MMERRRTGAPKRKDKYVLLIEQSRDELSHEDMEILLTVHEQPTHARAAEALGVSINELRNHLARLFPKPDERLTNKGEKYARRLTDTALIAILAEQTGLNDEERKILSALIGARNQVVAATSLDMPYSAFISHYKAIRRKHGF